jgi:YL1 nuclear protein/YL1 nuclear protein C-terminal domain
MSAITERSRRSNAGRRVTSLAGEALEQDESFWGHETWADDGSGNESFHSSDEDSELKRDEFDSDFDDPESDHENEELEAGKNEERELMRQERDRRSSSTRKYIDEVKSTKKSNIPRKGKKTKGGSKRIVGEGINAGIVLNVPKKPTSNQSGDVPANTASINSLVPDTKPQSQNRKIENKVKITAAATRPTRPSIRQGRQAYLNRKGSNDFGKKHAPSSKRKRRRYTQEELLMEAVTVSEPENSRWILARKRLQAEQEKNKESVTRETRGTVIERFISRRGHLNTINFPDMDHAPPILSRQSQTQSTQAQLLCVITGKPARYRDPKTLMGYYDLAAFKELRRRFDNNEIKSSVTAKMKSQNIRVEAKPIIDELFLYSHPPEDTTTSNGFLPTSNGISNHETSPVKKPRRGRPPKKALNPKSQSTQQSNIVLSRSSNDIVNPGLGVASPIAVDTSGSPISVDGLHASFQTDNNAGSLNSPPDNAASTIFPVVVHSNTVVSDAETQFIVDSNSTQEHKPTIKPTKIDYDDDFVEGRTKVSIKRRRNGNEPDSSHNRHHLAQTQLQSTMYIEPHPLKRMM